jgi:hypothetical protein
MVEKVSRLVELVQGEAPVEWIVDSNQADLAGPRMAWPAGEVRVLFLVRDVRSWVHSRSKEKGNLGSRWRALGRWVRTNRRIEADLRRAGRPIFLLGYEELALAPAATLERLCSWLGLSFEPTMLSPGLTSTSHILAGNRMRHDESKTAAIRYDGAWISRGDRLIAMASQLPPVLGMNRRLVYSNDLL